MLPALWLLLAAAPAWAALGEKADSAALDQERLHGERRSIEGPGYAVQEITAPGGTLVREYVGPAGVVFGLAWQGPTLPDLEPLLATHYPAFREAARARGTHRGPVVLRTPALVVESGGRMRAFRGRAFLPGRLPAGLTEAVVR